MPKSRKPSKNKVLRAPLSESVSLIVIDQKPLREKAIRDCRAVIRLRQKARSEWEAFDQRDRPAFNKWLHHTFGAQLTELRELGTLFQELDDLVSTVEYEAIFSHQPTWLIYGRIKRQRAEIIHDQDSCQDRDEARGDPGPEEGEEEDQDRAGEGDDADFWEEMRRFFSNMSGMGGGFDEEDPFSSASAPHDPVSPRVKEIYRTLVRRLHPDMIPDHDEVRKDLWHAVQEAYQDRDLEKLEMLLATCEMEEGVFSEDTPVSRMRETCRHVKKTVNALRARLRQAKKDPAWSFSKMGGSGLLRIKKNIEAELRDEIRGKRDRIAELKKCVAFWESKLAGPAPEAAFSMRAASGKRPRPRRRKQPFHDIRQTEFAF